MINPYILDRQKLRNLAAHVVFSSVLLLDLVTMVVMQSFIYRAAFVFNVALYVVQSVTFPALGGLSQVSQETTTRATPILQTWPDPSRLPAIKIPGSDYVLRVDFAWSARIDKQEYLDFLVGFTRNLRQQYPPPADTPYEAGDHLLDPGTLTRWRIRLLHVQLRRRVPMTVTLNAMTELLKCVRHWGSAGLRVFITTPDRLGSWIPAYVLTIDIEPLGSDTLHNGTTLPAFA